MCKVRYIMFKRKGSKVKNVYTSAYFLFTDGFGNMYCVFERKYV